MRLLVKLRKYHGLGNDFLVLLDVEGHRSVAESLSGGEMASLARAACSRHRGIGADGMLVVSPGPVDGSAHVTMRLYNADGSIAEMSGNGIRCFSQGVVDVGVAAKGTLRVHTDAGLRVVEVGASNADGVANIRVDMGVAKVDAFAIPAPVRALVAALEDPTARIATVDVGNPHLVVGVDRARIDIASFDIALFGAAAEEYFMDAFGGINVHVVARAPVSDPPASETENSTDHIVSVLDMTIWERGVGITEACGTGATAVAVAAHGWGWVGAVSELRQPGGSAQVEIVGEQLTLIGPSQFVASSEFAWIR
jgi:diaminopimelate epimerase